MVVLQINKQTDLCVGVSSCQGLKGHLITAKNSYTFLKSREVFW